METPGQPSVVAVEAHPSLKYQKIKGDKTCGGPLFVETPGQPSVVAVEAHPTLEYQKIKGDKTYVEVPWLWRPLGSLQ